MSNFQRYIGFRLKFFMHNRICCRSYADLSDEVDLFATFS